ncbi:MAG TPA: K+/H+ antiporter, partial [Lachnospiraceae bacterium]|nr:K+/H+ antiporter [Lachnospiraceae bacterium]
LPILIFIMFYGGFGTKWSEAKPIAVKAVLLSTIGVILTALLTGLFCYFILRFNFWESMLLGSVISSTDAAS